MECVCAECGQTVAHYARGLGQRCYNRLRGRGTLDQHPTVNLSLADRLTAAAEGRDPDECHPWPGLLTTDGYSTASEGSAHLAAWLAAGNEPPPPGMQLDHVCCWRSGCSGGRDCPHRRCVNARHLRAVTPAENTAASAHVRTGTCSAGHPKTDEHGYQARRQWVCRTCKGSSPRGTRCKSTRHLLTPENVYTDPSGERYCRACRREANQRRREHERAA